MILVNINVPLLEKLVETTTTVISF